MPSGKIILDLLKMPKPANAHRNVNLKMLDHEAPTINLFLERRVRGWWPLTDRSTKNKSNRIITVNYTTVYYLACVSIKRDYPTFNFSLVFNTKILDQDHGVQDLES